MFALIFRFPAGRYHATPWGRHVNEGAVAWPPEPYRILRALIAVWHRKADKERFPEPTLHRLVEALAEQCPAYRLPAAVHAHTRHYMPQAKPQDGKLVFDAFYRVDPDDELVVAWPELMLDAETYRLAEHLAGLMGYLGRAESLVIAHVADNLADPDALEVRPGPPQESSFASVDVLVALSAEKYAEARPRLLDSNKDKPKSKARQAFEATIPLGLTDALQVETSQIQDAKWSRPPAGRLVTYSRPEVGPRPPARDRQAAGQPDGDQPTVARLIVAGRPRPPLTDAVKIGEVFRRALMARVAEPVPTVLSGRDTNGQPLRHAGHAHAFFIPEDHDQDGFIDHLILYARDGLPPAVRRALESLSKLWIADGWAREPDENGDAGRKEWRVALEGFGTPAGFGDSVLLRRSHAWTSVTPYLRPWHLKGGKLLEETCAMVRSECRRRGWPEPAVQFGRNDGREIDIGSSPRNVLAFHRFRSRRGLVQPDRTGTALRLVFSEPICGPVALGFGNHFGLGLFRAEGDGAQV